MSRIRYLVMLSLPIVGGMVSQNVMNLVDTAMVGTQGTAALAAVGVGGVFVFMTLAPVMGFSAGVQAMTARRVGEGRVGESARPLHAAMLVILAFSLPWTALIYAVVPSIVPHLNGDPAVVDIGNGYVRYRVLAIVAVGANFAFRGFWNGIKRPELYMETLMVMHAANIILNWAFIFGHLGAPEMGAPGAGLASTIATFIGTGYYIFLGWLYGRPYGFFQRAIRKATIRVLARLSSIAGLQTFLFAAGLTVLYWIIGQSGTVETGAAHVVIAILLVGLLPGMGIGFAAASLVGQALGRGDPEDAAQWGWDSCKLAFVAMTLLGFPMIFFPDAILAVFIHDPATLAVARAPLQVTGVYIGFDVVGIVLLNALYGAGDNKTVMMVSFGLQWGLFLPLAYAVGVGLGYGLLGIWILQMIYRAIHTLTFAFVWRRGRWKTSKL